MIAVEKKYYFVLWSMKKQKMLLAKKSRENINWIEKVKDNIIFQKELEFYWKLICKKSSKKDF